MAFFVAAGANSAYGVEIQKSVESIFDYTTGSLDHAGLHVKASFGTNLTVDKGADVFPPPQQNYNPDKRREARTVYAYDVG